METSPKNPITPDEAAAAMAASNKATADLTRRVQLTPAFYLLSSLSLALIVFGGSWMYRKDHNTLLYACTFGGLFLALAAMNLFKRTNGFWVSGFRGAAESAGFIAFILLVFVLQQAGAYGNAHGMPWAAYLAAAIAAGATYLANRAWIKNFRER